MEPEERIKRHSSSTHSLCIEVKELSMIIEPACIDPVCIA